MDFFWFKYYVDDIVYWYTFEALGKRFVDNLGKRLHENILGYVHWFMSIIIFEMKDNSINVDQARYATSVVEKTWIMPQLRRVQSFKRPL